MLVWSVRVELTVSGGVGSLSGLARGQPPTPEVLVSVNTHPAGEEKNL